MRNHLETTKNIANTVNSNYIHVNKKTFLNVILSDARIHRPYHSEVSQINIDFETDFFNFPIMYLQMCGTSRLIVRLKRKPAAIVHYFESRVDVINVYEN